MSDDLSKVDWGREISIHGRPSWLVDGEDVLCFTTIWHPKPLIPSHINWHCVRKIKLRTDHPFYRGDFAQPPSDDIAKRMKALVRWVAEARDRMPITGEAQAIVALLDGPVDADREEAKRLYVAWGDDQTCEDALYAAIKRGRELERGA